jgi:hypothetical protein
MIIQPVQIMELSMIQHPQEDQDLSVLNVLLNCVSFAQHKIFVKPVLKDLLWLITHVNFVVIHAIPVIRK